VAVAVAVAVLGALVGSGTYVLGHLSLQQLLQDPLYDFA
jgi:membrane protein DedA with SNARE-associated domain